MGLTGLVKGIKDLKDGIEDKVDEFFDRTEEEIERQVDLIARDALGRTPRDTGRLRNSQHIKAVRDGERIVRVIEYKAPYALIVHESPEWNFTVGGAFYLSKAIKRRRSKIPDEIAGRLNDAL